MFPFTVFLAIKIVKYEKNEEKHKGKQEMEVDSTIGRYWSCLHLEKLQILFLQTCFAMIFPEERYIFVKLLINYHNNHINIIDIIIILHMHFMYFISSHLSNWNTGRSVDNQFEWLCHWQELSCTSTLE